MGVELPRAEIGQVAGPMTEEQARQLAVYMQKLAADAEKMGLI